MDSHIIIASKNGENPLISSIDPVNQQNLEIGIKSVSYGEISEFYFEFLVNGKQYIFPILNLNEYADLATKPSRLQLLDKIVEQVKKFATDFMLPVLVKKRKGKATQGKPGINILTGAKGVQILHVPRILNPEYKLSGIGIGEWHITNTAMNWVEELKQVSVQPGFIYCNLIENSYLNGHRSKLLQVVPFDNGPNAYKTWEVKNPNYIPIQVNQFSYLEFAIRDLKGELIKFSSYRDIVLTLHIRGV
eukprot:sb/3468845/